MLGCRHAKSAFRARFPLTPERSAECCGGEATTGLDQLPRPIPRFSESSRSPQAASSRGFPQGRRHSRRRGPLGAHSEGHAVTAASAKPPPRRSSHVPSSRRAGNGPDRLRLTGRPARCTTGSRHGPPLWPSHQHGRDHGSASMGPGSVTSRSHGQCTRAGRGRPLVDLVDLARDTPEPLLPAHQWHGDGRPGADEPVCGSPAPTGSLSVADRRAGHRGGGLRPARRRVGTRTPGSGSCGR